MYKDIYKSGEDIVLENFKNLQSVYSLSKNKVLTQFVFDNKWKLFPSLIGENLIGACLKGCTKYKASEGPNLKYVFLDIDTGDVAIELPRNFFIKKGFRLGTALIGNTDGYKFRIDKTGKTQEVKTKKSLLGSRFNDFEEENYEDPFINQYSEDEADNFYGMTDGMEGDLW